MTKIQMDYNTRVCYDRIIPQIASIVIDAFGVPKEVTKLHKEFWIMQYTMSTLKVPLKSVVLLQRKNKNPW